MKVYLVMTPVGQFIGKKQEIDEHHASLADPCLLQAAPGNKLHIIKLPMTRIEIKEFIAYGPCDERLSAEYQKTIVNAMGLKTPTTDDIIKMQSNVEAKVTKLDPNKLRR